MACTAIGSYGRRGALLLIVLTALTFFMMIGTLMLVTATRTRATARAFGSAANRAAAGLTEASAALDESLMVLLRGRTLDDESLLPPEMRGQSILEDKFGTDSLSGSAILTAGKGTTVVRPLTLAGPLNGTQGVFVADLMIPSQSTGTASGGTTGTASGTASFSHACDLNGRILTLAPPPGDGDAVSFRILRSIKSGANYTVFLSRPPASSLSLGIPRVNCPVVISGREYVSEPHDAFDVDPWLTQYALKNSHVDRVARPAFAGQSANPPVVDNDNDGVADGVWLSGSAATAVIPPRPSPLGGTLTFDVSYLVLDLDGRVNMNAHGGLTPLLTGSADWPTNFQSDNIAAVPAGMGYGTADIAASRLVATGTNPAGMPGFPGRWGNICQTGSTVVQQSSSNDQRRPTPRLGSVEGRYGPDLAAGQWSPGTPGSSVSEDDQAAIGGAVTLSGSTRLIGNSVTDLHVRTKAFVWQRSSGPPSLMFFTPDRSVSDFREPPYLLRLDGDGARGLQLRQSMRQTTPLVADDAFSLAELERMLRQYDSDAGNLPQRFVVLLDDFAERSRMTVTTDSWDTPVISGTAMNLVRDFMRRFAEPTSPSSAVGQGTAAVYDVMSPDVAAGLKFDLNRPLDHPAVPASLLPFVKETYCRHLYSLLVALGQPASQATAQWVANVCDFRDPDSTLTRFRYDTNPADGWSTVDSTEVFGCERPELVITETIAWDDKLSVVLLRPWDAKLVDNQTVTDQTQFDLTEVVDPALGLVNPPVAKKNFLDLGRRVGGGANGDSIWRLRVAGGATVDLAGLNPPSSLQIDTNQYLCLGTASSGTLPTVTSGAIKPPRQANPPAPDNGQVFLERLADPSKPLDNSSTSVDYNPYVIVDTAPLLIGSGTIPQPPTKMRRRGSEPARFWNGDAADGSYTAWEQVPSGGPAPYPDKVNWYHWPNRPFISAAELALVPAGDGSRPASGGQGSATPALDPVSRLFEAVQVPSRFAGLSTRIGDDTLLAQTAAVEGVLTTAVPGWREPGRVNVNTIVSNTGNIAVSNSGTTSLPLLDDAVWRATVGAAAGTLANPFATQGASATSYSQMLALGQPGGKLHQDTVQQPRDQNDFFTYATALRLANVGTIRSNVFAVWITVRVSDSSPTAGDPVYRRMFAIVDRSIPVGFSKGRDLDSRNAIRLKRYLD